MRMYGSDMSGGSLPYRGHAAPPGSAVPKKKPKTKARKKGTKRK